MVVSNNLLIGTIGIGGLIAGTLIAGFIHFNSREKFTVETLAQQDTSRTVASSHDDWTSVWKQYVKENQGKVRGEDFWLLDDWSESITENTPIPFSYKDRCYHFGKYKVADIHNTFYRVFRDRCTLAKNITTLKSV
ncbi:hypothetical protein MHC_01835 [Mycoplasma haemocanis str. Illinois]|uniref:Uncharacterized protein n=1 Tax=Mycoplasma haemocanis (strain Illinois) TaxID=1111676 RepID=H6N6G1_MYCHN|nr:hypothetical protein [Mycoplasma haemocanis]AEW45233.1 hypothetical protein MHC_01835 [Mycoplasma haemocanis str. Illinois]